MDLPHAIAERQAHALPPKPPGGKALERLEEFLMERDMTEAGADSGRAAAFRQWRQYLDSGGGARRARELESACGCDLPRDAEFCHSLSAPSAPPPTSPRAIPPALGTRWRHPRGYPPVKPGTTGSWRCSRTTPTPSILAPSTSTAAITVRAGGPGPISAPRPARHRNHSRAITEIEYIAQDFGSVRFSPRMKEPWPRSPSATWKQRCRIGAAESQHADLDISHDSRKEEPIWQVE